MKTVKKEKIVKLKNRYNGDLVETKFYDDVRVDNGMNFILVYSPANPNRTYYVNRDAFDIVK
jgi:hypothetical protein